MFENQPKGLYALALANTGERFGYYTMLAIFTLFMQAKFGWSESQAGQVYAIFLAVVYFAPLVGGMIADKIGYGKCVTIGFATMFLGYLGLAIPTAANEVGKWAMFAGLACVSLGTGLFKGNLQVLVGNLYDAPSMPISATRPSVCSTWPSTSAPCLHLPQRSGSPTSISASMVSIMMQPTSTPNTLKYSMVLMVSASAWPAFHWYSRPASISDAATGSSMPTSLPSKLKRRMPTCRNSHPSKRATASWRCFWCLPSSFSFGWLSIKTGRRSRSLLRNIPTSPFRAACAFGSTSSAWP